MNKTGVDDAAGILPFIPWSKAGEFNPAPVRVTPNQVEE